jgi:hypothetical protein
VTGAMVLGLCWLAVTIGWWVYTTREPSHPKKERAPAPATVQSGLEPQAGPGQPFAYGQHRWSGRRPRLELTVNGLRDSGQRVRFCLDCTAEKTEVELSTK